MGPCVVEEAEGLQGLAKEVLEVHEGQGQMHQTVQEVQEPEEAKVEEGVQRKGLLQKETRFQGLEEEAPCVVEEAEGLQGLAKEVLEVHEGQGQMHQTVQEVQEPEEAKVEEGVQRKGLLQKERRFQGLEEEAPCVVEEAEGLQGLAKEVLEVHEGQGQMHQTVQEVQEP